jgi:tRNA(Ile)-lysidine synthase
MEGMDFGARLWKRCGMTPDRTDDAETLRADFRSETLRLTGGNPTVRYGVAVSGGPDSMALLALAASALAGRVEAVTVDHGLRPESGEEAAMVARWCGDAGVPHETLTPDAPVAGNVQAWARAMRYRVMEAWRAARGIDWIMTAHHADDQAETLLMRLNRGSGVAGLAGVRARSGRVVRPLLGQRKAALLAFARAQGLPFVDDPSNRDPRFDRAAMRQSLQGSGWIDAPALARSAAALAEAEEAIGWSVAALADAHVRQAEGGGWGLDRTDLPREYLRRLVLHMLALAEPEGAPPRGEALDHAVAQALAGGKASLGRWLLEGGPTWHLRAAPPRR